MIDGISNRGCLMERYHRHHNCFRGKADSDMSEPDSRHATYPSLYEASWRADARMSISMRLSCKVSRNVCFAMFLHTGGEMDMKLV